MLKIAIPVQAVCPAERGSVLIIAHLPLLPMCPHHQRPAVTPMGPIQNSYSPFADDDGNVEDNNVKSIRHEEVSGDVLIAGDGGEPMDHHSESTLMSETYLRGGEEAVRDVWGDGEGAGVGGKLRNYNNESILRSESHHRGGEETVGDVGGDGEGGIYSGGGEV